MSINGPIPFKENPKEPYTGTGVLMTALNVNNYLLGTGIVSKWKIQI